MADGQTTGRATFSASIQRMKLSVAVNQMSSRSPHAEYGALPRPGLPAAGQRRRLPLSGARGPVTAGRLFTREALLDWRWMTAEAPRPQTFADDVLLLVSELLANACLHAGGPQELVLDATADVLRIEVADGNPNPPRPRPARSPGLPAGLGLRIVRLLADRWGAATREHGKTVWLEVNTPRAAGDLPRPVPGPGAHRR